MKVLRPPPTEENWFIKIYCTGWGHTDKGCGARLKVYRDDLRYKPTSETNEQAVTFKCMCCGALNDIGWSLYPPRHKELRPYKKSWMNSATE